MRLIGKRSVASVLRWCLGFVNVFVMLAAVLLAGLLIVSLVSPDFADGFVDGVTGAADDGGAGAAMKRWVYLGAVVSVGCVWLIFNRLRRILAAVNVGDAFEFANVRRLQAVAGGLAALEVTSIALKFAPSWSAASGSRDPIDLTNWLAVIVILILAEVFRQGAQMRDDAQMTV